jgi:hypothetical protein
MRRSLLIAFVAASLAACGDGAAERAIFDRAKGLKQGEHFKLADAVPGDWTSVCFYGGYEEVPALKIKNDETDWTLVFYRDKAEVARVQGNYSRLVLNSAQNAAADDCLGRDAVIVRQGELAFFRAGAR